MKLEKHFDKMTSDLTTIVGRLARGSGRAALAGGLAAGAVWLWDVSGGAPPPVLARGVVVVASGDDNKLATMNAVFRTIDLTALVLSPAFAGLIFDFL